MNIASEEFVMSSSHGASMRKEPMPAVAGDVDRVLTLLRNKIRERGFTQLEVQAMLGWGRSYISQLLTKQKALRLEQVLMILDVIEIDPSEFFGELYPAIRGKTCLSSGVGAVDGAVSSGPPELSSSVGELRSLVRGLVGLLVDRDVINFDELSTAVESTTVEIGLSDPR